MAKMLGAENRRKQTPRRLVAEESWTEDKGDQIQCLSDPTKHYKVGHYSFLFTNKNNCNILIFLKWAKNI